MGTRTELPAPTKKEPFPESELEPKRFRTLYDQALEMAEKGLVSVYSTGLDAVAPDTSSLSRFLIHSAIEWAASNHGILTLDQAVLLASAAIAEKKPQQNPEYHGGRRLRHFPFAVNV
jgi:hypothetical protein